MENKITYIDLFAGCGGLSLGLHQSGWKGIFAIEKSPLAFLTLKHNLIDKLNHFQWPDWLEQSEHDINTVLKKHKHNLKNLQGQVELVVGGPPCQGFSTAGRREEGDQRNKLIKSYIKFIRLVQPKMIFFENVKGFTQRFEKNSIKGIRYSEYVQKSLRLSGKNFIGYNVYGKLINFAEFGIPQKRTRFILVGIRKDLISTTVIKPKYFFDNLEKNKFDFLNSRGLKTTQNINDAISDLLQSNGEVSCPDSKGFLSTTYNSTMSDYQRLLRDDKKKGEIPDSHRFANHSEDTIKLFNNLLKNAPIGKRIDGDERKKYNLKKRGIIVFDKDKPSPTITSHPDDYIHYSEPRILTVRESARIQSFPDWFEFKAKYTTGGKLRKIEVPRYTQVGNAIPPLFGEQAGLVLKDLLNV
ncbi:MAG: DNA cytosine methyltransferase [Candidatus Tenebribacter mawsonii]|nr:DNA cytosine methyltransferase [Candidatus Tenebribacter mawsonii]